jgi:hypothetical protein
MDRLEPFKRRRPDDGFRRISPVAAYSAIVFFLNPQPALGLVGGNRSSCPNTDIRKEGDVYAAGAAHVV